LSDPRDGSHTRFVDVRPVVVLGRKKTHGDGEGNLTHRGSPLNLTKPTATERYASAVVVRAASVVEIGGRRVAVPFNGSRSRSYW